MTILYGIKTCDTVRKARRWLDEHEVAYRFHDFRADGLDAATVQQWVEAAGWERVLNKRGTTYRQLGEADKAALESTPSAALLAQRPTLIKRPVLDTGSELIIGFDTDAYERLLT